MNPGSNACRECVEWPGALARVRSTTVLAPPADAIVHALKYGGWPEVAEPLARLMRSDLEALVDSAGGPGGPRIGGFGGPVLVPVPTTPGRLRQRGYNQAARLAEALARLTGMPSLEALLRIERGGSQVALQREERRANVRGAFRIRDFASRRLSGRPVILVDDVLTTGATACEAAEVLTTAGAGTVRLLVFARTLPGRTPDLVPGSAPATGFFHAAIRRRSSRDRRRTETRTGGS